MYEQLVTEQLSAILARHRYGRVPEGLWTVALGLVGHAAQRAGEGRWDVYPQKELRALRRELAHALRLARIAADLQDAENRAEWAADQPIREQREQAGKARRRAQTMPAELARLAKVAGRGG